jgi:hypothetical protein
MPTKGSRRSRTAKKPKVDPNEGWFNIRRILDERVTQNGTEYLVDWEDDPQTGEVYEATWVRLGTSLFRASQMRLLTCSLFSRATRSPKTH